MNKLRYPDPPLTDGAVLLRPWRGGDLGCVREAASDPTIPQGTTVPGVFTDEAGRAFIERQRARLVDEEGISLAIADAETDAAVGLVWLAVRPQPGVFGIGYWLIPSARGAGLASRAVQLATTWLLNDGLAERVEAWVEPENDASVRLLERAGFEREGVLRAFLAFADRRADAVVFSRIRAGTLRDQ